MLLGGHRGAASPIAFDLAARLTSGGRPPATDDHTVADVPQGDAVILSAVPGTADSIVPRLEAAGADSSRLYVVEWITDKDGYARPARLTDQRHLDELRWTLVIAQARLLLIDNIDAFVRGPGTLARAIAALALVADLTGVAILCTGFLPDATPAKALRFALRRATTAASVLVVADTDDPGRHLVLPAHTPLTGDPPPAMLAVHAPPSRLLWSPAPAQDLEDGLPARKTHALALLQELLAENPVPARKAAFAAAEAGIGPSALRSARADLGVEAIRINNTGPGTQGRGAWHWRIPSSAHTSNRKAKKNRRLEILNRPGTSPLDFRWRAS